jgi:hypothetical protein
MGGAYGDGPCGVRRRPKVREQNRSRERAIQTSTFSYPPTSVRTGRQLPSIAGARHLNVVKPVVAVDDNRADPGRKERANDEKAKVVEVSFNALIPSQNQSDKSRPRRQDWRQ